MVIEEGATNNRIGGTATGASNLISGNEVTGIELRSDANIVEGNFIGTDVTGTIDLGHSKSGITIAFVRGPGSNNNRIGGTAPGASNLVSGNRYGILITANSTGNLLQGNFIGTDVTGTIALGNNWGIFVNNQVSNTTIGGTEPGARNIVSGNDSSEIYVFGAETLIQGNFIGTDVTGTVKLGVGVLGIQGPSSNNNIVGGLVPEARNIIQSVNISGSGATGNVVQGNFIGTDVTGTIALLNSDPVIAFRILDAADILIGGTEPGAGNVIAGGSLAVLLIETLGIFGGPAADNTVQGNFIGTDPTGTINLGNAGHGIKLFDTSGNIIGGTAIGAGNIIAHSGEDGVFVESGTNNTILGNTIHSNDGLGIDLGTDGVTPNDSGDGDTGANNLQNFPTLTAVTSNSISGDLNSALNATFRIEFFANTAGDASGSGEGETFLGATDVTTDGSGNLSFTETLPVGAGQFVTATATDESGNTSEFSAWFQAPTNQPPDCSGALASIEQIWPPNHKMVDIEIVGVTDPDGDPVTITITQITQDEPVNSQGDGNFEPDGAGLGTSTAQVRAERTGGGNGRVYEITFVADDGKGGACPGSVTVCVPHDKGKKGSTCIDDGQFYDSVTGAAAASKPVVAAKPTLFGAENFPNPFNPSTTIRYTLPEASDVRLVIYNVLGQQVRVLVNETQAPGVYSVAWDSRNALGRTVSTGLYVYRLEAGSNVIIRKMVFLK